MEKETKKSNVDHPNHYLKDSGHEVIDVIDAWSLGFDLGNAVKYIARAGKKNPDKSKEDLNKRVMELTGIELIVYIIIDK